MKLTLELTLTLIFSGYSYDLAYFHPDILIEAILIKKKRVFHLISTGWRLGQPSQVRIFLKIVRIPLEKSRVKNHSKNLEHFSKISKKIPKNSYLRNFQKFLLKKS